MAKTSSAMRRSGGATVTENPRGYAGWMHDAYGVPESERKALYYHSGYSQDTVDKMDTEKQKQEYAKYDAVTINEDLPEITGTSQKQIDYAKSVRDRAIKAQIEDYSKKLDMLVNKKTSYGSSAEKRKELDAQFDHEGVTSRSGLISKMLKSSKGAYAKYKNMTTAREILDNG